MIPDHRIVFYDIENCKAKFSFRILFFNSEMKIVEVKGIPIFG